MTTLNIFAESFRQEVRLLASREDAEMPAVEAFTQVMIDELLAAGVLEDAEVATFRTRGLEVNGYSLSDDHSTLFLLVSIHTQQMPPPTVNSAQIETAVRRATAYYERACADLIHSLEESTAAFDMTLTVRETASDVSRLRVIVLTDGRAVMRERPERSTKGVKVSVDVWDIRRLHQLALSGRPQEPIDVDFVKEFGEPIPCLPARQQHADYAAHLAVIPGRVIAEIYDKFGARLLERNVRAFLQARGKVNSGIRRTILDQPERFLAYNNGISATASGVTLVRSSDGGHGIAAVHDLQIVNGGQTTASIHHLAKRDRERSKVVLDDIFVQAKLTIVPASKLDEIVPLISLYANSQNKVNAADFQANSPFHVAIEGLSRTVWAPAPPGVPRMTRWFYERARGQYQDALIRELTPARQREFRSVHPLRQKFTKTDLAKIENCWDQLPHVVGQGAEKNFRQFTLGLEKRGKFDVDRVYFERLVGKAILYRSTERVVTEENFGGYRANTVAYTVAYVSWLSRRLIDLEAIWRLQEVSPAIGDLLRTVSRAVREVIVDAPGSGNVTEWCKKSECWNRVRGIGVNLPPNVQSELVLDSPETWHATQSIVGTLQNAGAPMGKWDIIEASGIDERTWSKLSRDLVTSGQILRSGNTRATTYSLPPSS